MKLSRIIFLIPLMMAACGSGFEIPDPIPGGKPGGSTPGDEDPVETPATPENPPENPPEMKLGMLYADGNDAGTYDLILRCGYNKEQPDSSGAHSSEHFRHIRQRYDNILRKYVFDFYLHIQNDDDRGLKNITDRQRNEIKTDAKSPACMVAQNGETLRMSWKFMLPAGMKTTNKFSHIHQLKGIDNSAGNADVGNPLITFTCRSLSSGGQQFQIIHTAPTSQGSTNTTFVKVDLKEFLGQWVTVTETVEFSEQGSYTVSIVRMSDGKELVSVKNKELYLWRDGTTGLRPKWGLYRYFGEGRSMASQLRDEILSFADFNIEKL